jgi:hypothetical protein
MPSSKKVSVSHQVSEKLTASLREYYNVVISPGYNLFCTLNQFFAALVLLIDISMQEDGA